MDQDVKRAKAMLYFPPELIDVVFDALHTEDWEESWNQPLYGKRDLHACSLVSRTWHAVAREHLFRDVVYSFQHIPRNPEPENDAYARTSPNCWYSFTDKVSARYKTFPMFCAFVDKSPAVQRSIRHLRLEAWPSSVHGAFEESDKINTGLFVRLLKTLPSLTTLHLYNIVLSQDPIRNPSVTPPSLCRLFISFKSELYGCERTWHDSTFLVKAYRLLACFSRLRELHLRGLTDGSFRAPNGQCELALASVQARSLVIESAHSTQGTLYHALCRSPLAQTLTSLTFTDAGALAGRSDFVHQVGPHLQRLRYELPIYRYPSKSDLYRRAMHLSTR
jgi:hypothetical protein